jgi:beta-phosphoglucomutase-like phosphatase (HAD superfamily)
MLGLPARACVAFEDSPNGLQAAKAAELFTVVTPSAWTVHEDVRDADLELPHLGDERHPLPAKIAAVLGSAWLDLAALRRMRGASFRRVMRA